MIKYHYIRELSVSTIGQTLPENYRPGGEIPPDHLLLAQLREQLYIGGLTVQTACTAVRVARVVGDRGLELHDQTHLATAFGDIAPDDTVPTPGQMEILPELPNTDSAGDYNSSSGGYRLSTRAVETGVKLFKTAAASRGLDFKHPGDPQLFASIALCAHEAAHGLLAGVSYAVHEDGGYRDLGYDFIGEKATPIYLAKHPELGITGDWWDDLTIFEERFAKAYEDLTLMRTLEALGYTGLAATTIMEQNRVSTSVAGRPGENQLDWLGHSLVPSHISASMRRLGYPLPLTTKQLVDCLHELGARYTSDQPLRFDGVHHARWAKEVSEHQDPTIRAYLDKLIARRQRYLRWLKPVHTTMKLLQLPAALWHRMRLATDDFS